MENNQNSVNQRISLLQEEYSHLTQRGFAEKIGVSQSSIAALFTRGTRPGFDTIQKILSAFPEVSADWLLMGTGPMLRDNRALVPATASEPEAQSASPTTPLDSEMQQAELKWLKAQLEHQQAQIAYLMKRVAELSK